MVKRETCTEYTSYQHCEAISLTWGSCEKKETGLYWVENICGFMIGVEYFLCRWRDLEIVYIKFKLKKPETDAYWHKVRRLRGYNTNAWAM